jgi:hypothetical protein
MFDITDPSLQALLDGSNMGHGSGGEQAGGGTARATAEEIAEKDRVFATVVKETVSPAIYRLLSNMVVGGDESGDAEGELGESGRRKEEERLAKESYVDQLVDCWAGCASVLVQHGDQVCLSSLRFEANLIES